MGINVKNKTKIFLKFYLTPLKLNSQSNNVHTTYCIDRIIIINL